MYNILSFYHDFRQHFFLSAVVVLEAVSKGFRGYFVPSVAP
jgi:hypothetical protein